MEAKAVSPGDWDESRKASKTEVMVEITRRLCQPSRILVVGCGNGIEAGVFARAFGARAVGIDVGDTFGFDYAASAPAELHEMDARKMDFPDGNFDFVYSFHALEHIPGPVKALAEMARVLRPGGHYLIGTPNKDRLLGYVGSARSLREKVRYNLADWRMRLRGRWSNEMGAHAGFSEHELVSLGRNAFGDARVLSDDYYRLLYSAGLVKGLRMSGLKRIAYPCVYIGGRRA